MSVCCPLFSIGKFLFMCVVTFITLVSVSFHSLYFASRNQLLNLTYLADNRIYFSSKVDRHKIDDSLNEFYFKIVLKALAAQDSSTEILTVIWMANRVHSNDCIRHSQLKCPCFVMKLRKKKILQIN